MTCNSRANTTPYRGRLAPSPTGYLHLGHARTFWIAQERARARDGTLILRNEDLDPDRAKPEFAAATLEDLRWFGFHWHEGPDLGGPFAPYTQSKRRPLYFAALQKLHTTGFIYPCACSRQDVLRATQAPHQSDEEPIYPGTCRNHSQLQASTFNLENYLHPHSKLESKNTLPKINFRFRVPDGEAITFEDACLGPQTFTAGQDFGDFVLWRHDAVPSYQLAVTVDDAAMRITEVVRGADLLLSTARQLLLYRALGLEPPAFYHCPLMTDAAGIRLAKRHDALSLRTLREQGATPAALRHPPAFLSGT